VIWIAWRYQRSITYTLALLALIIIGFTVATGTIQHHDLVEYMSAPCRGNQLAGQGDYCGLLNVKYSHAQEFDTYVRVAGFLIAPLVGALLGLLAMANEVDHRTVRLAWTQSISRTRWFVAKAGVGAASVVAILVPTAIVLSWWNGEIRNSDIFSSQTFGIAGWDLVAYGLFMFALTLLLGVVIRRTGWALAAAIVLFLVVAISVPTRLGEHLVSPTIQWSAPYSSLNKAPSEDPFPSNAWLLVNGIAPRSTTGTPTWNDVLLGETEVSTCMSSYPTETPSDRVNAQNECYRKLDFAFVTVYIGPDEFWTLQLREGLLYLVSGLILTAGAWAFVRRIEP
jgi:hypothetical protein